MLKDSEQPVRLAAARALNDLGVELSNDERKTLRPPNPNRFHSVTPMGWRQPEPVPGIDYQELTWEIPELLPLSDRARHTRAIPLLERAGSEIAVATIRKLAQGGDKCPLTQVARRALLRALRWFSLFRKSKISHQASTPSHSPHGRRVPVSR